MLMTVERIVSGTSCALMVDMLGQNSPRHASNTQNASSWQWPCRLMPPLLAFPNDVPAAAAREGAAARGTLVLLP
jgi:hypothetical protein